jgi:hypothetical protein
MRFLPGVLLLIAIDAQILPMGARTAFGSGGGGSSINTTPVQTALGNHNSFAVPFISSTTAGNMITVMISHDNNGGTVSGCSDGSNTYVQAVTAGNEVDIWYAKNIAGGSITVTCSGLTVGYQAIQEWSGANTSAPLDATATSTTGTSVGPLTTALDNELLLVMTNFGGPGSCSGFTTIDTAAFFQWFSAQRMDAGTAGSKTATGCTVSNKAMAAFK